MEDRRTAAPFRRSDRNQAGHLSADPEMAEKTGLRLWEIPIRVGKEKQIRCKPTTFSLRRTDDNRR
jgi:hypothetical protein